MSDLDVLVEFLKIPLNSSDDVFRKFQTIPGADFRGDSPERFLFIEGTRKNRVVLVAHADTVWHGDQNISAPCLVQENGIIKNKNGGLGADDRAGCAMIWLLKDLGHSILITDGEESGRQGSNWLMSNCLDIANKINKDHQFAVQLDRRNGTDYKCYNVGTDEFREYVEAQTKYKEPDRSSFTDIVTICRDICGVNLGIGYHNEHCSCESLNINEWKHTLDVCRRWLSQDNLPKFPK